MMGRGDHRKVRFPHGIEPLQIGEEGHTGRPEIGQPRAAVGSGIDSSGDPEVLAGRVFQELVHINGAHAADADQDDGNRRAGHGSTPFPRAAPGDRSRRSGRCGAKRRGS